MAIRRPGGFVYDRPLSSLIRELVLNVYGLARSEFQLAKTEIFHAIRAASQELRWAGIFILITLLGLLTLLASAIIGLGHLLGDRYALSAFLWGIVLGIPGAFLANNQSRRAIAHLNQALSRREKTVSVESQAMVQDFGIDSVLSEGAENGRVQ